MARVLFYLIIAAILLFSYAKYIELRGVFFPVKGNQFTPQSIGLSFDDIYCQTKDGFRINAWFIPCANAKYTLFFLHGNAGNIGDRLDKIAAFHRLGINILIIDYRGFGKSQGRPSEKGLYLDAQAGYDYLLQERNLEPEEIILYGESLGTAVAIDLAETRKIKALIMEGAFTNAKDMARAIYPFLPSFILSYKFDSLSKIRKVTAPKLFMHSQDDEIVPFRLAEKLYAAASEPKYFSRLKGSHNTAFLDCRQEYISSIISFIDSL